MNKDPKPIVRITFFFQDMLKCVQETPRNIRVPTMLSPGGVAGVPPSAPRLLTLVVRVPTVVGTASVAVFTLVIRRKIPEFGSVWQKDVFKRYPE